MEFYIGMGFQRFFLKEIRRVGCLESYYRNQLFTSAPDYNANIKYNLC